MEKKFKKLKSQFKREIIELASIYDQQDRGNVGRGLIDKELADILATHFAGYIVGVIAEA